MKNKFPAILSLTTVCCLGVSADSFAIDGVNNSSTNYTIGYKGINVGNGTMRISKQETDKGTWNYKLSFTAESTGFAKLIGGQMTISDITNGSWKNGNWYPTDFNHTEKTAKGTKQHSMYFNWPKKTVNENKDGRIHSYDLIPNTIDYGTTFLALQSMASKGCVTETYGQLASGVVKSVTIRCEGEETLAGKPVYKFSSSNAGKSFNAYLSRDGNNELQRFVGMKDGKTTITLNR